MLEYLAVVASVLVTAALAQLRCLCSPRCVGRGFQPPVMLRGCQFAWLCLKWDGFKRGCRERWEWGEGAAASENGAGKMKPLAHAL